MKSLTTGTIDAVLATSNGSASTFEIVNTQFVEGVSFQEQQGAMESLNSVVKNFDGFLSRSYFYSEELNRWTDIVVWENADLAQSATAKAMENPEALAVFSKMDSEKTIFSHYQPIGHIEAELTSK